MARQKKKRNKSYTGSGAAVTRPTVTRMSAVNRNKLSQWWVDNKRVAKPALIAGGVVLLIIVIIIEIIRLSQG